jgi:hypothetical protein
MDDIVTVKVRDSKANNHFFITWGRIFDRVNPKSLEVLIAAHAQNVESKIKNQWMYVTAFKKRRNLDIFTKHYFTCPKRRFHTGLALIVAGVQR